MPLLHEQRGHVAILTFSRPEARNAWGDDCQHEGSSELPKPKLEDDRSVRVVILTGDDRGGAFSVVANIKKPETHTTASIAKRFYRGNLPKRRRRYQAMNLITDFSKPVIAAVNGFAVGIGCIVTYGCDLIVSSEKAEVAAAAGWGSASCRPRAARCGSARWVVGAGIAMRVAMGFPLKADEAYRAGLLAQWVVPHDELMGKAMEVAEHIARRVPPLATRLAKKAVNFGPRRCRCASRRTPISTASCSLASKLTEGQRRKATRLMARSTAAKPQGSRGADRLAAKCSRPPACAAVLRLNTSRAVLHIPLEIAIEAPSVTSLNEFVILTSVRCPSGRRRAPAQADNAREYAPKPDAAGPAPQRAAQPTTTPSKRSMPAISVARSRSSR